MGRVSVDAFLTRGVLRCPACATTFEHVSSDQAGGGHLACLQCGTQLPIVNGVPLLLAPDSAGAVKERSREFWGELYHAAYAESDQRLTTAELQRLLDELESMFRHRRHLAVVEMPIADLRGKDVLEIGSGAGAHSALFALRGARMTSVDLTADRVFATARKFDLLPVGDSFALQADAEYLPFNDASFDIVYSNGVLHHTPDTERAVREVHRVLKPGGRAVVMLYAKYSFQYLVGLWLIQGLIKGGRRRGDWLGRATEWMSAKPQRVHNPVTKVYSAAGIRRLFGPFRECRVRKNSFQLSQIPKLGAHLERSFRRRMPLSEAGMLVYGMPWRYESALELWLGRWMGFGLNIVAVK